VYHTLSIACILLRQQVKRHLLQVVKDEVKQEAFGFSEIPHKQTVRVYLKEVRYGRATCPVLACVVS
jgi:hypothetical protein